MWGILVRYLPEAVNNALGLPSIIVKDVKRFMFGCIFSLEKETTITTSKSQIMRTFANLSYLFDH